MTYFKDKLYWMLLIPGILLSVGLFLLLSQDSKVFILIVPVGFWVVYYAMRFLEKKNTEKEHLFNQLNELNQMPSEQGN